MSGLGRDAIARQLYATWCARMDRTDPVYEGTGAFARQRRRPHWDFLVDSQRAMWYELAATAIKTLQEVEA